jgi:polar amino acid transport system substrate-binding protein
MKFLYVFISIIFLTSCSSEKDDNMLIVGTSADNPPYEFIMDNKITGFDIDIAHAIGEKLQKKIIIKNLEFNGLLAALNSKNADFIIAGLSITPQRSANIDFSIPYLKTKIAVLYRAQDSVNSIEDLRNKIIGVQLGTVWEQISNDLAAEFDFKTHSLSNNLMLIEELKSKAIDAMIIEEAQGARFTANNSEFKYFVLEDNNFEFAIGLPKNSELKPEIDKAIKDLELDGEINAIKQKWQLQ